MLPLAVARNTNFMQTL